MGLQIGDIEVGKGKPLLIIAGPCVIESWELISHTAQALKEIAQRQKVSFVFKASFDKANRTAIDSFRGVGLEKGLAMLSDVKKNLGVPVLSDVHETWQCDKAAAVLDVLQIPAFLCRQTDLVVACARTGKAVNIKKGQFLAPADVLQSVRKVVESGNKNVSVTERGITFGYNNLIVDFRAIPIIQENENGCPVIFDATHSVQLPSGGGTVSGGQRQFIPTLTRSALAAGAQGLFMEVHPNPDQAKSDAATQLPLAQVEEFIAQCVKVHELFQSLPDIAFPQQGKCVEPALTR